MLAATGRAFAWTACGMAASGLVVLVTSPPDIRKRFMPLAFGLGLIAIVAVAPWLAKMLA